MPTVKVKRIPRSGKEISTEDVLAQFCYYFPQYTFVQARKLPAKRIKQMLRVVDREEAKRMYQFAQIIASQHTKKMSGMKKILESYKSVIERDR